MSDFVDDIFGDFQDEKRPRQRTSRPAADGATARQIAERVAEEAKALATPTASQLIEREKLKAGQREFAGELLGAIEQQRREKIIAGAPPALRPLFEYSKWWHEELAEPVVGGLWAESPSTGYRPPQKTRELAWQEAQQHKTLEELQKARDRLRGESPPEPTALTGDE